MQERRQGVRRQSDMAWANKLRDLEAQVVTLTKNKEQKRKRRHVIRHACKIKMQMLIGVAGGFSNDWDFDSIGVPGKLLDLSADGAQIFTRQRMETGQKLRIAIELRNGQTFHTPAEVRWVKEISEKNGFGSGLQFGKLEPQSFKMLALFLNEVETTAGL